MEFFCDTAAKAYRAIVFAKVTSSHSERLGGKDSVSAYN